METLDAGEASKLLRPLKMWNCSLLWKKGGIFCRTVICEGFIFALFREETHSRIKIPRVYFTNITVLNEHVVICFTRRHII